MSTAHKRAMLALQAEHLQQHGHAPWIGRRQLERYKAEHDRPSGRNLGPHWPVPGGCRRKYWIAVDFMLPAGAMYFGQVLEEPRDIESGPLAGPFKSLRQAKLSLRRIRTRVPAAFIVVARCSLRHAEARK